MNKRSLVFAVLSLILLCTAFFFLGRNTKKCDTQKYVEYKHTTDTVVVRDTLYVDRPVPVKEYIIRRDTVWNTDTTYILLPITTKLYENDLYRAQVSGYNPTLDWVEVYPEKQYVLNTITQTKTEYKTKRWGLGLQLGVGTTDFKRFAPYLGVGINFNILTW